MPGRAWLHTPPRRGPGVCCCLCFRVCGGASLALSSRFVSLPASRESALARLLGRRVVLCLNECVSVSTLPRSLRTCGRLPSTRTPLGLLAQETWHCLRIAASATSSSPPLRPRLTHPGLKRPSCSGLAPAKQTQESSEHPSPRSPLLPAPGSNWRGAFRRPPLHS